MFHSLRFQTAVSYVLLIILIFSGLGIYLSNSVRQARQDGLQDKLTSEVNLLASQFGDRFTTSHANQIQDYAQHIAQLISARVTVIAADGTVLGDSFEDPAGMDNHSSRPEIQAASRDNIGVAQRFSQTTQQQTLYVAAPVFENGERAGYIRISLPTQQIEAEVRSLQAAVLTGMVLAAVLAIVLAILLAGITTRDLQKLSDSVANLSLRPDQPPSIPTSSGEVGHLAQAFAVVTRQLQNQYEVLEKERGTLAAVLEQMTDGVILVDENGEVQLVNPAARRLFQIREHKPSGKSLASLVKFHQFVDLWQQARRSRKIEDTTLELVARKIFMQGTAIPLDESMPGSILLIFQDLTTLRRLETVRRDFISNISHELRTPLASLKALTETLQETALDDPPAARRFLSRMDTELDALTQMVQELLELSRIESGKVPLKILPVEPELLLEQAVERLHLQAERMQLHVKTELPEENLLVLADRTRIEQVLVNLLHNAIKFTRPGGSITLRVIAANQMAQFSIADTGDGISAEHLPRIFERFFKSDRSRSGWGTGLGLAIAKHLVEAHHGNIWAESIEGQGSIFYFTLPRQIT